MATTKKKLKESTVYVSVPAKMSVEQTHSITNEILRILGCPACYSGFKIHFIDESDMINAHIGQRGEVNVSA
ncbi:MAG: hypothetical protein JWP44_300 [Mucilaginibacter sp.]|nr:hypothetical protein [Mucilaginibacter sp.]